MVQTTDPTALYARLAQAATPGDLCLALCRLGDAHRERLELEAAAAAYEGALRLGPSAQASLGRGVVALIRGEPSVEAYFQAALTGFVEAGDAAGAATAEGNLGAVALGAGRVAEAEARQRAALSRLEEAGLPADPLILCNLGRALGAAGAEAEATDALERAADLAERLGRGAVAGMAWLSLGELHGGAGRPVEATGAFTSALGQLSHPSERARALLGLMAARHRLGDPGGAADALEAALPALRASIPVDALVAHLVNLGGLRYQAQDPAGAAAHLDEAAALLPPALAATTLARRLRHNRGLTLIATGRLAEARADLSEAARLARLDATPPDLARVLGALVDAARMSGDLDAALEAQAEIAALQQATGARVAEVGMVAAAVEDRSLNISTASLRRRPRDRSGPVLMLAPPAHGATGPLFPRGAVSVASFLQHHGVPAAVLPLAHVSEPHLPAAEAARRVQAALRDAMHSLRPRAVGISVTFSYLYPQGLALAEAIRALDAEVPILMGGPHVTYQDEECLRECAAIDVVVRGEGEWTALELVRALEAGRDLSEVQGVTWRAPDGSIRKNPKRPLGSVLELPPEDFGLLPASFCQIMDITALTSRGCAYRCRFCHEFRYWGGVVREHPVERVIAEMDRLARYGNTLQGIDDSMLDMRTPFFHALVDALGQSPHLSPNFGLLTRLDTITEEGAAAMRKAGMRWVCVGVESGSQKVLNTMNKEIRVEQIRDGLVLARRAGLSASGFLIIGHPGDNPEESAVTRGFVDQLFRDDLINWLDLSTFSPYPGTPYHSAPERHGVEILVRDWNLWRRTNRPVAQLTDYPAEQIYLNLLAMLRVQDQHVRGRPGPPALGSGSGGVG